MLGISLSSSDTRASRVPRARAWRGRDTSPRDEGFSCTRRLPCSRTDRSRRPSQLEQTLLFTDTRGDSMALRAFGRRLFLTSILIATALVWHTGARQSDGQPEHFTALA